MNRYSEHIVCCYLYPITRYGYPPTAAETPTHLAEMAKMGFKSVELEGVRSEHLQQMHQLRHEIKTELNRHELSVPYYCTVLPGLSSPNAEERAQNLVWFEKGCETAAFLGAKGVLDNAPLPPYVFPESIPIVRHYEESVLLQAGFPKNLHWDKYWQELTATYREACDIAASKGLTYNMHPCLGVLSATTDAFLYFADAVNRDNLRFNLDTANQFALKDNLTLSLLRLKDRIDYIHISDNRGTRIEHLPVGEGEIFWEGFLETVDQIGFSGHFGVDVGGEEPDVEDLTKAYIQTADWLEAKTSVLSSL